MSIGQERRTIAMSRSRSQMAKTSERHARPLRSYRSQRSNSLLLMYFGTIVSKLHGHVSPKSRHSPARSVCRLCGGGGHVGAAGGQNHFAAAGVSHLGLCDV